MDSRQHRRVRLRLPVRLRWTTPFGQKIELADTIDVSRSGALVSAKEPHSKGVMVWLTFPYDSSLSDGQPEILARVVRCEEALEVIRATNLREKVPAGNAVEQERSAKLDQLARAIGIFDTPATFAVAFQFEEQPHSTSNGNTHRHEPERRGSARRTLAIPVRVHPERIPWFEEAMAIDVSAKGMRFRSYREYALGDHLKISFQNPVSAPWHGAGEFLSEVVRVASVPGRATLDVGVRRME
ncbi:MAG TPA: PilZ domain-containing protein [Candidatus Polarisedimenticolia bacterium]|nr:PilZ domain-containing protein [Candidatus Polarisedimenticolia bacterium]